MLSVRSQSLIQTHRTKFSLFLERQIQLSVPDHHHRSPSVVSPYGKSLGSRLKPGHTHSSSFVHVVYSHLPGRFALRVSGWSSSAEEVRALRFHPRLTSTDAYSALFSSHGSSTTRPHPFPAEAVIEPWNWVPRPEGHVVVACLLMLLPTVSVIDGMSSTELNDNIVDQQLLVIFPLVSE